MPQTATATTDSFCERCGTRYAFDVPRAERKRIGANIGAMLRGRDALGTAPKVLDPFLTVFRFCLDCRQYTCPSCWNEEAGFCVSCVPPADIADRNPVYVEEPPAPAVVPDHTHDVWPTTDLLNEPAQQNGAHPLPALYEGPDQAFDLAWEHLHFDDVQDDPAGAETHSANEWLAPFEDPIEPVAVMAAAEDEPDLMVMAGVPSAVESSAAAPGPGVLVEVLPADEDEIDADSDTEAEAVPAGPVDLDASAETAPESMVATPPAPDAYLAMVADEAEPEGSTGAVAAEPPDTEPATVIADGVEEARPQPSAVAEPEPLAVEVVAVAPVVLVDAPVAQPPVAPSPVAPSPPTSLPLPGWRLTAPDHIDAPAPDRSAVWPPTGPTYQLPTARPFGLDAPNMPLPMPAAAFRTGQPQATYGMQPQVPAGMPTRANSTAHTHSDSGIRPCSSCGLALSAIARFCRRCGTPQG